LPDDTPLEEKPISWALVRLSQHAALFAELSDEERRAVYEALGCPAEVWKAIEEGDREKLQAMIDAEWPDDPDVVFHAVLRGVVR
jgi:hypothetical protein